MSYSKQTPSLYKTERSKNNQIINTIIGTHDLCCGCNDPTSHLTHLLITTCKPTSFNKKEKEEIKQWCGTLTEDTTGEEDDQTGLLPGELDALFAEEDTNTEG